MATRLKKPLISKKAVHFSLDMETLAAKSTRPAILSIGIVEFDPTLVQTPEAISENPHCHMFLSLNGQTDQYNRVIEGDTIAWWMQQDDAARSKLFAGNGGGMLFPNAIQELNRWIASVLEQYADVKSAHSHAIELPELYVWSYGVKSDLVWWNTACEATGETYPVGYRNEKCLRMLSGELPQVPRVEFGVKHDALDDAIAQAAWAQRLCAKMDQLRKLDVSTNS